MTTYYVGPGGSDANNGQSWANRKLTLNGAEDIPVASGDTIYVGPGAYRETLTIDVSGSSGSPITYIADVTGEHTDGVGGVVRITGSDNDLSATRTSCITSTTKNYRTFRGFSFDGHSGYGISQNGGTNWITEDCSFFCSGSGNPAIGIQGAAQAANTIRRCFFAFPASGNIQFTHTATVDNTGHLVENCVMFAHRASVGVSTTRVGGITIKNSLLCHGIVGVQVATALSAGQTIAVNNCIFVSNGTALSATAVGEITEDYNCLFGNTTTRTNTSAGANSNTSLPLLQPPLLASGYRLPWMFGALASYSQLVGKAGTGESSDDLFGQSRPATSSKKSWGAVQFVAPSRDTGTVRTGSASIKLADARRVQIFVPVTNASTVFSVYVRFETDYAGTKPQMVIKQPGQSDTTATATGSSGAWEQLTATLTPAATPGYVVVELVSNNTATSGSYATYFDDLTVTGLAAATNFDAEWLTDTQRMNAYMQTPPATGLIAGTPFKGPFG